MLNTTALISEALELGYTLLLDKILLFITLHEPRVIHGPRYTFHLPKLNQLPYVM